MNSTIGRSFLIHWNFSEAEAHAQNLSQAGREVEIESEDSTRAGNAIKDVSPQVVVIYLFS